MSKIDKKDLLSRWLSKSNSGDSKKSQRIGDISPMPESMPKPLSYGQKRLWLLQQLHPENIFYNYTEIYDIKGLVDVPKFEKAIEEVIQRHDILRSTFESTETGPIQIVHAEMPIDFVFKGLEIKSDNSREFQVNEFAHQIGGEYFDLANGPLIKIGMLDQLDGSYVLVINMHHIITDKWSMRIFREEMADIYNAYLKNSNPNLTAPKIQYADFAYWQQNKDIDNKQLDYWKNKLAGSSDILDLPFDHKRPKIPSHKGAFYTNKISQTTANKITSICKEYNTTPFVVYLSVFYIMLRKYCRQDDILVGTPISNRSKSSLENIIGFFNDTIVLRSKLDAEISFSDYLINLRKDVLQAFENKDIPFEVLVKELGISREANINPLFQTMFLYHKVPEKPIWDGFDISYKTFDLGVSKFDLTLYVAEDEDDYSATFEYTTDLFERDTIVNMHAHYVQLLDQVAANPEAIISTFEMASPTEAEEIYALNNNDVLYPTDIGIHTLIEDQLERRRHECAVVSNNTTWTYEELISGGKKVAAHLLAAGIKKGDVVAVCTNRSNEMVGAILGVLMTGAVYMPLDPSYPRDRISYMLEEAKVEYVLCEEGQEDLFANANSKIIYYTSILEDKNASSQFQKVDIHRDDIAYLIFTSGSSGKPKGVIVTHGNIVHSTMARNDFYTSNPERFLLLSSFAFDSSMVGLFWTLCTGGSLVLTPEKIEQDMQALSEMIVVHKVSHTLMLPSLYQLLLDHSTVENLQTLQCVIVAGEACNTKLCKDHFQKLQQTRLYNEYGPTEASVWCTGYEITKADINTTIPIGTAISSTDILILDSEGHLVPRGVPGEIHVGGRGITKGYINRDDLTSEKFINHSFLQEYPSLLYKTGDLGKMRKDGIIEFLGRVDQQIKIRGFRVELTEIQSVLQTIPEFEEVVVVATKSKNQDVPNKAQSIVAFFVSIQEVNTQAIKSHLGTLLPDYMVPAILMKLDEVPKLPNGKYNYKVLETMDLSGQFNTDETYVGARNDIEKALVDIWEEVLGVNPIGIYDNFFSLGGDSILSIQINGRSQNKGLKFPANEIFKSQTIEELARQVEVASNAGEQVEYNGEIELTPIQKWYLSNFKNKPGHWHLGVRFNIKESISHSHLSDVIEILVRRHESLRLTFDTSGLMNANARPFEDEYLDIIQLGDIALEDKDMFIQDQVKSICASTNIMEGPLFKCLYFEGNGEDVGCIIFVSHHLVVDQVSWGILIEEFDNVMLSIQNNKEVDLGVRSISYNQWSEKLHQYSQNVLFKHDLDFWDTQFLENKVEEKLKDKSYQESEVIRTTYSLGSELCSKVLIEIPEMFDAKVNEILMSALGKGMQQWRGYETIILETEGHGRESLDPEDSFFNSIGWFTTVFPIFLDMNDNRDSHTNLQYIKNKVRSIPTKGLTFGIAKYLADEGRHTSKFKYNADVLFNYLGKSSTLESKVLGKGEMLAEGMRCEQSERSHPLELNAYVDGDDMVLNFSFVRGFCNEAEMDALIDNIKVELSNIIENIDVERQHNYVPADFEDADLDEDDLDSLFEQL